MTLLKDEDSCSTYSVRGLDNQLIAEMNVIYPNLLSNISDIPNIVFADNAVHPWLQSAAKKRLTEVVKKKNNSYLTINSAFRTLAGQQLLYKNKLKCGFSAVAVPGKSNHNNASAIDIAHTEEWRSVLQSSGWKWLGEWDNMHYDCIDKNIVSIHNISVKAFQRIWNRARPTEKLDVDGDFGEVTQSRLLYSPVEGFPGLDYPRILKLTQPNQIGKDVGYLQSMLRDKSIPLAIANCVFGKSTEDAVKIFQALNGLLVDGIVGKETGKLLGFYYG